MIATVDIETRQQKFLQIFESRLKEEKIIKVEIKGEERQGMSSVGMLTRYYYDMCN